MGTFLDIAMQIFAHSIEEKPQLVDSISIEFGCSVASIDYVVSLAGRRRARQARQKEIMAVSPLQSPTPIFAH